MRGFVLGCLLASACVWGQFGNFTRHSAQVDETLARDAVTQLVALYPPAATRLALRHASADPFGQALLSGLRQAGYAVVEAGGEKEESGTLPFAYVLDEAQRLCRVMLVIGKESLSRAYQPDGAPMGSWARREGGA